MMKILFLLVLLVQQPPLTELSDSTGTSTCSQRIIEDGDNVTLDFSFEPPQDVTGKNIEWRFNKSTIVFLYRSRGPPLEDQGKQFRGRVKYGSGWNPTKGKIPLTISSVSEADEGTYTCYDVEDKKIISCIELLFKDSKAPIIQTPAPKDPEEKPGSVTGWIIAVVVIAVIVGILIALIAVIIVRYKQRNTGGGGEGGGGVRYRYKQAEGH